MGFQTASDGVANFMDIFPADNPARRIASRAAAIVHYQIDSNRWLYRQETENDVGRDCVLEMSLNGKWKNQKIEGQIKGTTNLAKHTLKRTPELSFSVELKTVGYGLGSPIPFVFFFVDVRKETIFFLEIQEYYLSHKEQFGQLSEGQKTINLRVPDTMILEQKPDELCCIAQRVYKCDSEGEPSRVI